MKKAELTGAFTACNVAIVREKGWRNCWMPGNVIAVHRHAFFFSPLSLCHQMMLGFIRFPLVTDVEQGQNQKKKKKNFFPLPRKAKIGIVIRSYRDTAFCHGGNPFHAFTLT